MGVGLGPMELGIIGLLIPLIIFGAPLIVAWYVIQRLRQTSREHQEILTRLSAREAKVNGR